MLFESNVRLRHLQVGRDLQDPVRLNQYESRDVEETSPSRQKRLVLDPGDDVMK